MKAKITDITSPDGDITESFKKDLIGATLDFITRDSGKGIFCRYTKGEITTELGTIYSPEIDISRNLFIIKGFISCKGQFYQRIEFVLDARI